MRPTFGRMDLGGLTWVGHDLPKTRRPTMDPERMILIDQCQRSAAEVRRLQAELIELRDLLSDVVDAHTPDVLVERARILLARAAVPTQESNDG